MLHVFIWWLIIQILGWAALPVAYRVFRWLPDRGFAFSKPLGLLLASYFLWLGATTGFLRNGAGGILAAIGLLAAISAWIFLKGQDKDSGPLRLSLPAFLRQNKAMIWRLEILFTVGLVAWAVLRAYADFKINPAGGEKFMEIAFLNGILNSPQFPPLDPWLSGFAISYYYFGYVMMAFMTRLSGAVPGVGFDLYDALLFALTLVGVFGVVFNLVASAQRRAPASNAGRAPMRYGLFGALLVTVMGNLEGFLEALYARGVLPANFWNWINIPGLVGNPVTGSFFPEGWLWWWRASRVIQDYDLSNQPLGISPITEFPFFSFLLGDNHPHVLALPFVLLAIALALNLLRRQMSLSATWQNELPAASRWNPVAVILNGEYGLFLMYALCLGALGFLNTWDMPIYIGLVVLAYGVGEYALKRRLDWELLRRALLLGAGLLLAAILLYFLFYTGFGSQAGGILPYVFPPTRLPQYLVMFGVFIFVILWFLVTYFSGQARRSNESRPWGDILRWWGWVVLASAGIFVLVLAVVAVSDVGRQMLQAGSENPALLSVLGGLSLTGALRSVILSRLSNPWLFLLLSFLLGLAVANLARKVKLGGEEPENPEMAACSSSSDVFTFLLIFAGLALTLSVEFFYLRDYFGVRMNTVFKFYYQGWIMLGCASAYAVWWLLNPREAAGSNARRAATGKFGRNIFFFGCILLVAAGMVYPVMASYSRAAGFRSEPNLDGAANIAQSYPDDWAAIEWLRSNALPVGPASHTQDVPVILEAPGESYNYEGRISAFTGLPAVLGWKLHEGQWRGDYVAQDEREPDIQMIYSTSNSQLALDLLRKWQVRYVIVGATEQNYINRLCADPGRGCSLARALRKFDAALTPVFQQGNTTIYEVPGG